MLNLVVAVLCDRLLLTVVHIWLCSYVLLLTVIRKIIIVVINITCSFLQKMFMYDAERDNISVQY